MEILWNIWICAEWEVGYTSTKLLSVHVRDAFRISTCHCLVGFVFKCTTHGIRCSSAGTGGNQTALYYCRRPLLDWGWIACIRHKAWCTEPRGPYRDISVRIHVPCHAIYTYTKHTHTHTHTHRHSALQKYWNSKDKIALLAVESRHLQIWLKDEYEKKLLFIGGSLAHNHSSESVTHRYHQTLGLILWNTFSAFNAAHSNCCLFWGVSAFTLIFSWWNSCSIGFKSGDWLGQSKTFHLFSLINSLTELAGCFGSLSWCNMKHFPMNLVAFSWILVGKMILYMSWGQ